MKYLVTAAALVVVALSKVEAVGDVKPSARSGKDGNRRSFYDGLGLAYPGTYGEELYPNSRYCYGGSSLSEDLGLCDLTLPIPYSESPYYGNTFLGNPALTNRLNGNPLLSRPLYGNPALANSLYGNPALRNPLYGNSALSNPLYGEPHRTNSLYGNPLLTNRLYGNPALRDPLYGNPALRNPLYGNSLYGNPLLDNPGYEIPVFEEIESDALLERPRALA